MSMRKCRRCGQEHEWTYGAGVYCSDFCKYNIKICQWCGAIFQASFLYRTYCDGECRSLAYAEMHREEVRLADKKNPARYVKHLAANKKYSLTDKGRAAHKHNTKTYLETLKGKEWIERHKNTWRGKAAYLIHILHEPCAVCGEDDVALLECDHIRPRAMNGTDDWSNLQVLCFEHHDEKSAIDIKKIQAYLTKVAENAALTVMAKSTIAEATKHDVYQEAVESLEGISNA